MEDNRAAFLLENAGRTMYGDEYARMLAVDFCLPAKAMERLLAEKEPPTERQVEALGERMRFRAAGLVAMAKELEDLVKFAPLRRGKVVALHPKAAPAIEPEPVKTELRPVARSRTFPTFARHEKTAMRFAVVFLAVCTVGTYASLESVAGRLETLVTSLDVPRVRATVIPGVPAALEATWRQASAPANGDLGVETWLTARIENVGFRDVGQLNVDLAAVSGIREIYAYSHIGGALGEARFAPKVTEGGKGTPAVSISLPNLPPAAEHWLFFGLETPAQTQTASGAPVMKTDPRSYFKILTVTAKERSAPDRGVTSKIYGWAPAEAAPQPPRVLQVKSSG